MLKNYLKIILRNIRKHKVYSFINITGLSIGMACCILILFWVQDELSYDRFHNNIDELHRVVQHQHYSDGALFPVAVTPEPMGPAFKAEYPEILEYTRFRPFGSVLIEHKDNAYYEKGFGFADSSFFRMFTFAFIQGDPRTALNGLNSVVITQQMANKYFGDDDPLGKTLTLNNQVDFMVTGVIEKVPPNSHLQFDFMGSFSRLFSDLGWSGGWWNNSYYTYVQVVKDCDIPSINSKIFEYLKKINERSSAKFFLQPVKDIHLYSSYAIDLEGHSESKSVYVTIFSMIAGFVLLIGCINFMNLTTARSANRAKEIGLRKVVGAKRMDLMKQFFGESMLLTLIALLIAIILVWLALPAFNELSGKQVGFGLFNHPKIIFGLVIIVLTTGVVSGSYPAIFLSSLQPVKTFKDASRSGTMGSHLRKGLVVLQFSLSIILIMGALTVYHQLDFMQNKKLGYDQDHILHFRKRGNLNSQYESFKNELSQNPNILGVTTSSDLPTYTVHSTSAIAWEGKGPDDRVLMHRFSVDHDYIKTFGIEMIEGRDFSKEITTDTEAGYVVNEEAVKQMGLDSPIGKRFTLYNFEGQIIGVMKNFHFKSLHVKIEPLVLKIRPSWDRYVFVRVRSEDMSSNIKFIEKVHQRFNTDYPFEFTFLEDTIDRLYREERRISRVVQYFTCLALFISCIGLFGLAAFMAEQRTKEIGIRKVLGSSVSGIVLILSKAFAKWVLVANVLAWPTAYFLLNRWLQNFAYRTSLPWWIFFLSGWIALMVALVTVSYQSIRASLVNPVEALKYE